VSGESREALYRRALSAVIHILVGKRQSNRRPGVSEAEYERFAEQFVELIVDPKQAWLVAYILNGGLNRIPTEEEFESGKFALHVLNRLERDETEIVEHYLWEALTTGDRKTLVPYCKQWALNASFTDEEMRMLLKMGKSSSLRQSYKRLNSKFRFHRGATPKLALGQYPKALERADQLRPAIEKVLTELASRTLNTLPEILEYCRKDYPEACEFLLRHIRLLEQAFKDKRVMNRATKRISAKARALADAMAGSEYGLSFSTSIERVRQARRSARPQSSL